MKHVDYKLQRRIVGGVETKINEYPMMAAIINFSIRELICGATIISTRYAMSAAHCFRNLEASMTGLLVGEHDVSSGIIKNVYIISFVGIYLLLNKC